jgi:molybdenum cofactor guanylyltransferase
MNHPQLKITGLVLAGGRGTRMGEVDKGLQPFRGEPMVAHVLTRLAPQVDCVLINANRHLDHYQAFGHKVIADDIAGFAGPLAGLHAGMMQAATPLIVTCPCDSPFLPTDLVSRLAHALHRAEADIAMAKTFNQLHPVFCLTHTRLAKHLGGFLASGERKIDKWTASLRAVEVAFDDCEAAFTNINTADELKQLERQG